MENIKKPLPGSGRVETQYHRIEHTGQGPHQLIKLRFSIILKPGAAQPITDELSRKEALARLGPAEEAVTMVREFAEEHGLKVEEINRTERKVTLSGNLDQVEFAFHTKIYEYEHPEGNYLSHEDELHIPVSLHKYVLGVLGLHMKPVVRPRAARAKQPAPKEIPVPENELVYTNFPPILAKLYDFPRNLDGAGQKIALLQLGGGYKRSDLKVYFESLNLKLPVIKDIFIGGGVNDPKPHDMKTLEVYSDICMAGAVANEAELLVYFAGNNHLHALVETFQAAVYDGVHEPNIISCSWGSAEKEWNPNDIDILESILEDAKKLRITTIVASGDAGSGDGVSGINVDYPASSPLVLGCGGTVAYVDPGYNIILGEVVWNGQAGTSGATGGGVSAKLPLPEWQEVANVPEHPGVKGFKGRGVPDFSAVAGFHKIFMFGEFTVTGGTSCGAPFLAALMAMANQKAGKNMGFINDVLYKHQLVHGNKVCQDITHGSNGMYRAAKGWNPCTGLGRPIGKQFVDTLIRSLTAAEH